MIWNNCFNSKLLTFCWTPVQDARGRASASARDRPWRGDRPCLRSSAHPEGPARPLRDTEDRAWSVSARRVTGPLDLLRVSGPSTPGIPSLPVYTRLGFCKIWDHLQGENAGCQSVCPGLVTSHTVQAFLALPFLVPNRVPPPLPADASQSL